MALDLTDYTQLAMAATLFGGMSITLFALSKLARIGTAIYATKQASLLVLLTWIFSGVSYATLALAGFFITLIAFTY